jgi:nucleotide-binding universal stress UspA family protein
MSRVLVPLDGSHLAESILPDARRLAGPDGELILVRDAGRFAGTRFGIPYEVKPVEELQEYLEEQACLLRAEGVRVSVHTLVRTDIPMAIDEAARIFGADLIACATHGRGPLGRLVHGGVAWRAVAHSTVPVLLRHAEAEVSRGPLATEARRIMVPLDGSTYAEKALGLAQQLALEWHAPLWLAQVIAELSAPPHVPTVRHDYSEYFDAGKLYLTQIAGRLSGEVHTYVIIGGVVEGLVSIAQEGSITDIVLASHGRTGLSRVILGSIADGLIHRLHLPIIVIPALATGHLEDHGAIEQTQTEAESVGVS